MGRDCDLRILERTYEEGDLVYLLDTASVKGKCKKLSSPWKGLAVITKKVSASLFMPPTSKKLEGHIASGLFVRPSVRPFVTLFDA